MPPVDRAQGWYDDPFGLHEHRWFSAGEATSLVRDGDVEADDPPPSTVPRGQLSRAGAGPGPTDGSDLRRADDGGLGRDYVDAVLDTLAQVFPLH